MKRLFKLSFIIFFIYFGLCQFWVGNWAIDFFNFCHQKVQNFEISNLFERNWNFAVIFWKYQKPKRKSTKYFKTSQKTRIIPLKFCEMSLVSSNLFKYCKITQFLIKFCKSLKEFRKILLQSLGKTVKYCLNFVNFCSCTLRNGQKLANFRLYL